VRARPEIFVESSALVAWAVWEARGKEVAGCLRRARVHWLSALANAECGRALARAAATGHIDAAYARGAERRVAALVAACRVIPVDDDILARTGRAFPLEPVRTLDAIHLASLLRAKTVAPHIALLSLDERVRSNGARLGVEVIP
jgi:predicted nucleic acid-binding protein